MKESESFLQDVLPSFSKPQMFISTCRMQVLPPRRKKFARWPKSFPSMSKNNEQSVEVLQKLSKKLFSQKYSLDYVQFGFDNLSENILPHGCKRFLNLRKRSKIVYLFLQNNISNEEVPMITHNVILTDLLKNICHKAQKMFARCPKLM